MKLKIELSKDFELIELLGQGLSSEVYKGLRVEPQTEFTQVVAIKIFKSDRFRNKFQNELKNLSKINHPNIIGVKDWGKFNNNTFLVTEYVHGHDLYSLDLWIQNLNTKTKKFIANEIFKGLNELRCKGIAHADLKPTNILISISGEVKLIDVSFDDMGQIFATPEFTAPEVLSGSRPNFQSDLYSLGVLLSKIGLVQKKLLKLQPGDRVFEPYPWINEPEEKLNLSQAVRNFSKTKKNFKNNIQSFDHTQELASGRAEYQKSNVRKSYIQKTNIQNISLLKTFHKLITKTFLSFAALQLILIFLFGIYKIQPLPKVYSLKLRSLNAYEFWNDQEWVTLPTDQIVFAKDEDSLKRMKFRTPKGEVLVSLSNLTDFSKNIVVDAL